MTKTIFNLSLFLHHLNFLGCLKTLYFDGLFSYRDKIARQHISTLGWLDKNPILLDLKANKSELVWLSGKPGSGKSILSKHLVDDFTRIFSKQQGVVIASFFFNDRGVELEKSQEGFLRGLLYQMLSAVPSLFKHILPRYRSMRDVTRNLSHWHLEFLEEALILMIGDPKVKRVIVLIDGLDECQEGSKIPVLDFITETFAKQPSSQIFITSRPEPAIDGRLRPYPTIRLDSFNNEDIKTYVTQELQKPRDKIAYSPETVKDLAEATIRRSKGVFLWVKFVVTELAEKMYGGSTELELKETLDAIPESLQGIYFRILKKIEKGTDSEAWRMLEWVLFAERPLTLAEFRYAIAIGSPTNNFDSMAAIDSSGAIVETPEQMRTRLCRLCGGLLEAGAGLDVASENEVVQLMHQSVKEFLLTIWTTSSPDRITSPQAQTHLARVCLKAVTFPDYVVPRKPMKPFLEYATIYWAKHASLAEASERLPQMEVFDWPKTKKFFTWREAFCNLEKPVRVSQTPLGVASSIGLHVDAEKFLASLIIKDVDNGSRGSQCREALEMAAAGGHEKVVRLLIKSKANINCKSSFYDPALRAASLHGHEKIVQLLIGSKADVNYQRGGNGTALQAAALGGHERVVRLLINNKADVNRQGGKYGTALQAAAIGGHEGVAQLLINNRPMSTVRVGNTVLRYRQRLQKATRKLSSCLKTMERTF